MPIAQLPALHEQHARAASARTLALELPWTEAILRVLENTTYRRDPRASESLIAAWLGLPVPSVEAALVRLADAGVLICERGRYVVTRELQLVHWPVPP